MPSPRATPEPIRAHPSGRCPQALPPQFGEGAAVSPEGAPFAAAIDGAGDAWRLPLPPLTAFTAGEPNHPNDGVLDARAAAEECVFRMVTNYKNAMNFMLRAAADRGPVTFKVRPRHHI